MTRFPTAADLSSWAGLCPGNNESAGRHFSGRTRKGNTWLRGALGEAATAAGNTRTTHLAERHRRLTARRGKKRATVATARIILETSWHLLTNDTDYKDLGRDWHLTRSRRPSPTREIPRRPIHPPRLHRPPGGRRLNPIFD